MNVYGVAMMNILPLPNAGVGTTFPGAAPTTTTLINGVPTNTAGYNYIWQEPYVNQPRNSVTTREDYHPTDNDTISATIKYWTANQLGIHFAAGESSWGWNYGEYAFIATQSTLDYTHAFTPRLINEMYFGGMHDAEQSPPVGPNCNQNQYNPNTGQPTQICGQYNPLLRANHGVLANLGQFDHHMESPPVMFRQEPTPNPTSFSAAADTFDGRTPLTGFDYNWSGTDNVTYIYGPHTFKAGIYFQKYQVAQVSSRQLRRRHQFCHHRHRSAYDGLCVFQCLHRAFSNVHGTGGQALLSTLRVLSRQSFLQDTWKVNHKLTLDYGLRVYYSDPWNHNVAGVASSFVASKYDPTWGGHPPVLYTPAIVNGVRRAINPLTGANYPQAYIGNFVPGTGNTCNCVTPFRNESVRSQRRSGSER